MNAFIRKIRRGPKLEGYAFANFGYSSGTEGKSHHEKNKEKIAKGQWIAKKEGVGRCCRSGPLSHAGFGQ